MMNFLRKHQKKLFIVITVMTILSFTFFGTFNTIAERDVADKQVGKAIDGSLVMERQVHALIRFLSMGPSDILKNDLLSSGLISILAEKHFAEIEKEFGEKLDRAKRYTPYTHPQAPFVSAVQVWNRFVPQLPNHLNELKAGDLSAKTFAVYCQLYLDQAEFPPEIMARVLHYQQQQFSWMTPDRDAADPRRQALFGAQTFEEWFGPQFSEVLGQFIFNAAAIAEKKGYKVSTDEARADLLQTSLQALRVAKQEATFADALEFMRGHLQMTGVDESQMVKLWKKVMLVHRMFNDVGNAVLVDPLSYEQFSSFADEKATVEVYQLPEFLRLSSNLSQLKLHYYLEAVAPRSKAELPRQFFTPEEVEKKLPELVVSWFDLTVAKTTKEEIGSRLTLKETWDFEASDDGWNRIVEQFPMVAKDESQGRLAILDGLEPSFRLKIDRFARGAIIDSHPEWIEEALSQAVCERQSIAIRSKGGVKPFDEIEDTSYLREFLTKAPQGEMAQLFTQDQETYYRIIVHGKPEKKEVLTFKEALESGALEETLDARLQAAYPDIRKKNPADYQLANGAWKPFSDVKERVAGAHFVALAGKSRLEQFMEAAKINIQKEGDASIYLKSTDEPLVDQWKLLRQTKEIKRSESTTLSKQEMFTAALGEWSSVAKSAMGDFAFYKIVQRDIPAASVQEKMTDGQFHLSTDAKRLMMLQVLETIDGI